MSKQKELYLAKKKRILKIIVYVSEFLFEFGFIAHIVLKSKWESFNSNQ